MKIPSTRPWRPLLAEIFVSPSEPRLRAGWRLTLQVILQSVLMAAAGVALVVALPSVMTGTLSSFAETELMASQIAELAAVTASIYLVRRILDRRSFPSLGLQLERMALVDFVLGIAITFLMMGLIFSLEWLLGWLEPTGFAWQFQSWSEVLGEVGLFLIVCLMVGWNEELMSRGYHLQTIASGTTLTLGWIISSTAFGLLHLANPHANLVAVIGILLAGLFLGYAYIRTGRLWLSIGLHTGWNFFEGVVFGFPVSGLPFYRLMRTSITGPETWTGGAFGPEAGLVLIPSLALGTALIFLYSKHRGRA
ncbi:MAG TPA: CPBP family intramembrane glutamic endopeptidase [Anaerolineales bacterium]